MRKIFMFRHNKYNSTSQEAVFPKLLLMDVWRCLDLDLIGGAEFLASQKLAAEPSPAARHLYALVLYRQGRYAAAAHTAKGSTHLGCAYVYAQSCLKLEAYSDGISALETVRSNGIEPSGERGIPDRAAVELLLGKLYAASGDDNASLMYAHSAKSDPWLWENVLALCQDRTINLNTANVFKPPPDQPPQLAASTGLLFPPKPTGSALTPAIFSNSKSKVEASLQLFKDADSSPQLTPARSRAPALVETPSVKESLVPFRRRILKRPPLSLADDRSPKTPSTPLNLTMPGVSSRSPLGLGEPMPPPHVTKPTSLSNVAETIASIYQYLANYECKRALEAISQLPHPHQASPDMLAVAARCHFELVDYKEAAAIYERLRKVDPYRLKDMEYYSTVLWHLKREAELGFLAHELIQIDRLAWQPWVVMGNSFSLQQDPSRAIACFDRAIHINPKSAYAYTLQGHEYVAEEKLQSAQDAFRLALRADPTHYNAWYGLGTVFIKMDSPKWAEHHFGQALRLNPNNAVLVCFMGTCLEAQEMYPQALTYYKRACKLQPSSAVARYKKAQSFMAARLYPAALVELKYLHSLVPEEANVHLLLGEVYMELSNRELAIKHLTQAAVLDPKVKESVKQQIDLLEKS